MPERVQSTITKTFLSGKPNPDAKWVSFISFCLLFLLSDFYWRTEAEYLVAHPESVFSDWKLWQLFTSTFIHANFKHFISNSFMLSILIFLVYGYYGSWQLFFLLFPIGALINAATLSLQPANIGLLGISGVVYAMCAFWLVLYVFIDRQRTITRRIVRSLGFALIILLPTTFEPQVSYKAHFIGFLFGGLWGGFSFFHRKAHFRSHEEKKFEAITDDPYFFQ